MSKMRVNELAKKMDISNKELIAFLNENNIASVTSHANNITDDEANKAISMYNSQKQPKPSNAARVEAPPVKKEEKENIKISQNNGEPNNQQHKKKFVMKINPQNMSDKSRLAKLTHKGEKSNKPNRHRDDTRINAPGNSLEEQKRQEILDRQRKIEEFRKNQEDEQRKQEQIINEKRQQLIREKENEEESIRAARVEQEKAAAIKVEEPKKVLSESSTNQNHGTGAESTQGMEQRKDFKPQGRANNSDNRRNDRADFKVNTRPYGNRNENKNENRNDHFEKRDSNRRDDNRPNNGTDRFQKKANGSDNGYRQGSGSFENRGDKRQPFKSNNQFSRNNNSQRGGFDKDKDEQDNRNAHRDRPRVDKSKQAAPAGFDDRIKKAKDKVRESKESRSKDKDRKKDKLEKLERNISLERTSKKTHKQALKNKQIQQEREQAKEQEKVSMITIPEIISIKDLADKMKLQASALIKELFLKGKIVTLNQEIDFDTAEEIAMEHDVLCELIKKVDVIEEMLKENDDDESTLVKRPPVVCVMGHVDHGKTSLLDAIRNTNVIDKEAGGITQHIGAYVVKVGDQKITFLDTPGHEAFTAMRMRGASSTDIAILVVAADDGVMPQTVEAISHARAAGVEIIVAINKIDKPSANLDRVKQELSDQGLIPEDWGGSNIFVPVSAKTGKGLDELLEMILLTAEVAELKANPNRKARGLVLEAKLDKGRGSVANILIQKGTLHVGDFISAGHCSGKVRAMIDDKGRKIKEASISTPVEILGLNDVPNAGEIIIAHDTDKDAKSFASTFVSEGREKMLEDTKAKMSLDDVFAKIKEGNLKELSIVVKADVQGSAEAIKQSLEKLSNDEVIVKIIHSGVGAINESDVTLASASDAIIIGFNVRPDTQAKSVAEAEGVDIRLYGVIYQAIEDVEAAMKGMLDPIYEEKVIGHAEIRQIFKASGIGNIAGSYVLDGSFERDCKVRISRGEELIFEGKLASLKRFKDDVKEVKAGFECGLVFDGFNDIAELDTVEAYKIVEVKR